VIRMRVALVGHIDRPRSPRPEDQRED
jgi:hypothetical protein